MLVSTSVMAPNLRVAHVSSVQATTFSTKHTRDRLEYSTRS